MKNNNSAVIIEVGIVGAILIILFTFQIIELKKSLIAEIRKPCSEVSK